MTSEMFVENIVGVIAAVSMFLSFVITGLYLATLNHLAKAIQQETPTLWKELSIGRQVLIGPPTFLGRFVFGNSSGERARLGAGSRSFAAKCKSLFVLGSASWIATVSLMIVGSLFF